VTYSVIAWGGAAVISKTADLKWGGRFKPAFAERDEKQIMIDLRGISSNW
jgi:hypothetical protein